MFLVCGSYRLTLYRLGTLLKISFATIFWNQFLKAWLLSQREKVHLVLPDPAKFFHMKLYYFALPPASPKASSTLYIIKLLDFCQSKMWQLVLQCNLNLWFFFFLRIKYEHLCVQLESMWVSNFYPFSITDLSMNCSMNFLKRA